MARSTRSRRTNRPNNTTANDDDLTSPPSPGSHIDARPHLEGRRAGLLSALAQCTVPAWASTVVMVSLIFGGCCSNVFALEAIIKEEPGSGYLITFTQFLLVALEGLVYHFDASSPTFLKKTQIPLHRWAVQILLFFSVSVLNNHAFGYNISVPVHIILRSGGSMTTLLVGWVWGKKYSRMQVASVVLLTVGCVLAAMGDSKGKGGSESSMARFLSGLAILFVAQVLSAFMGLYIEATYATYGNNYREGLFYTHALSLPLFLLFAPQIRSQFHLLMQSPPLEPHAYLPIPAIPRQLVFLLLNAATQYVCIRGVNILGSVASALTVTIVLNIRKLVSLLLSVWLFGNVLGSGVLMGATVVFAGGLVYGLESQRLAAARRAEREAKKA